VVGLAALVSTAVGLAVPLAAKLLVDTVAVANRPDRLPATAALLFALGFAALAVRTGGQALHAWVTAKVLFDVRLSLFRHLQRLPRTFFARSRTGDLLSRLTADVAEAQSALADGTLGLVLGLLAVATSAVALVWLSWQLALVSFLFAPGLAVAVRLIRPRAVALAKDLREQAGDAMSFLGESIGGMAEIQAFGLFDRMNARYRGLNDRFIGTLMAQQATSAAGEGLPALFLGAGTLCVIALGAAQIEAGSLTWGGLVAFLAYQWRFHGPLRGLAALYLRVQRARVALGRVLEIADVPAGLAQGGAVPADPAADLCLDALTYRYPGAGGAALADVTATFPGGRVTAVVGASGAGKSTLLHLLLKVLEPTGGAIRCGDQVLADLDGDLWRARVAVVGQDAFLFHDTIAENVRLARPEATDAEVHAALQAAGLPNLDPATVVGERGARLSGGERQRVSLARALLRDPPLLILDEATAALDPLAEDAVWEAIRRRAGARRTTVLVTHRIHTALRADEVLVLEAGRIAEAGSPHALAARGGSFARLLAAADAPRAEARP